MTWIGCSPTNRHEPSSNSQRLTRCEVQGIFPQASAANFGGSRLARDHSEWALYLELNHWQQVHARCVPGATRPPTDVRLHAEVPLIAFLGIWCISGSCDLALCLSELDAPINVAHPQWCSQAAAFYSPAGRWPSSEFARPVGALPVNVANADCGSHRLWHCRMAGRRSPETVAWRAARRVFHGWVAGREPACSECAAAGDLDRSAPWRNQCAPIFPRHDLLHLLEEFAFACLLGGKLQTQIRLRHGPGCCRTRHAYAGDLCRGYRTPQLHLFEKLDHLLTALTKLAQHS